MKRYWPGSFFSVTLIRDTRNVGSGGDGKGPTILPARISLCNFCSSCAWRFRGSRGFLMSIFSSGRPSDSKRKPWVKPVMRYDRSSWSYPSRYPSNTSGLIGVLGGGAAWLAPALVSGGARVRRMGAVADGAGVFVVAPLAVPAVAIGVAEPRSMYSRSLVSVPAVGCPAVFRHRKCRVRVPHQELEVELPVVCRAVRN